MKRPFKSKIANGFGCFLTSVFPLLLVVFLSVSLTSCFDSKARRNGILERLVPLCGGVDYVYRDFECSSIDINFSKHIFDNESIISGLSYDGLDFLFFNDTNYYFLLEKKTGRFTYEDAIYRTDSELNNIELIYDFGREITNINRGADQTIYFKNDDKYCFFDMRTNELKEVETGSIEEKIALFSKKEYWDYFGYYCLKCDNSNGCCYCQKNDKEYIFDEKEISEDVYLLMKEFDFQPYYFYLHPSKTASVLYYAYYDNWCGMFYCLIINFDLESGKVNSYNLFDYCDGFNFRLYPNVDR